MSYLTMKDIERMFSLPKKYYSYPATWSDGAKTGSLHPSYNTPRATSIVPSGILTPVSTDYGTKSGLVAGETIRAGQRVAADGNGRVVAIPETRKEGNLPKYTNVITKPSGFIFRVTAKIPHPTLEKLVMIPIEGDLFTVERNDEWNVDDTAMYIAPGEHFCGTGVGQNVPPAVAFLLAGSSPTSCVTVNTRIFAGIPSRGFLVKPPKDYPRTATPGGIFSLWSSEQRGAARAAADLEAKKKADEEREAIESIAELVGMEARQLYIDRANGALVGNSIRLVVSSDSSARLEMKLPNGSWKVLDHIKVTAMNADRVRFGPWGSFELARW